MALFQFLKRSLKKATFEPKKMHLSRRVFSQHGGRRFPTPPRKAVFADGDHPGWQDGREPRARGPAAASAAPGAAPSAAGSHRRAPAAGSGGLESLVARATLQRGLGMAGTGLGSPSALPSRPLPAPWFLPAGVRTCRPPSPQRGQHPSPERFLQLAEFSECYSLERGPVSVLMSSVHDRLKQLILLVIL